jgi:FMN reductase
LPLPTSIFAAPEDWSSPELGARIDRAVTELTQLMLSGVGRSITNAGWEGYQHQFGGNATQAEQKADDVNFDSDLMRLAAGGSLRPQD